MPALPVEMEGHGFPVRRQAPEVGQHTREILGELGLAEAEIAALFAGGIVVGPGEGA